MLVQFVRPLSQEPQARGSPGCPDGPSPGLGLLTHRSKLAGDSCSTSLPPVRTYRAHKLGAHSTMGLMPTGEFFPHGEPKVLLDTSYASGSAQADTEHAKERKLASDTLLESESYVVFAIGDVHRDEDGDKVAQMFMSASVETVHARAVLSAMALVYEKLVSEHFDVGDPE